MLAPVHHNLRYVPRFICLPRLCRLLLVFQVGLSALAGHCCLLAHAGYGVDSTRLRSHEKTFGMFLREMQYSQLVPYPRETGILACQGLAETHALGPSCVCRHLPHSPFCPGRNGAFEKGELIEQATILNE